METLHVLAEFLLALHFRFNGRDGGIAVGAELDQIASLAAKSGAGIKIVAVFDDGGQQQCQQPRSFILDLEVALAKSRQPANGPVKIRQDQGVLAVCPWQYCYSFLLNVSHQLFSAGHTGIYQQDQRGLLIVTCTDPPHLLLAVSFLPASDQPIWVIEERGSCAVLAALGGKFLLLAQAFPEDTVDKTLQIFGQMGGLQGLD